MKAKQRSSVGETYAYFSKRVLTDIILSHHDLGSQSSEVRFVIRDDATNKETTTLPPVLLFPKINILSEIKPQTETEMNLRSNRGWGKVT